MDKIKITQVKSIIDRPKRQKDTIKALGLKKMGQSVEQVATPQILGMVAKVNHLVSVTTA
jgi:large subunit ribosomal protein L30